MCSNISKRYFMDACKPIRLNKPYSLPTSNYLMLRLGREVRNFFYKKIPRDVITSFALNNSLKFEIAPPINHCKTYRNSGVLITSDIRNNVQFNVFTLKI